MKLSHDSFFNWHLPIIIVLLFASNAHNYCLLLMVTQNLFMREFSWLSPLLMRSGCDKSQMFGLVHESYRLSIEYIVKLYESYIHLHFIIFMTNYWAIYFYLILVVTNTHHFLILVWKTITYTRHVICTLAQHNSYNSWAKSLWSVDYSDQYSAF